MTKALLPVRYPRAVAVRAAGVHWHWAGLGGRPPTPEAVAEGSAAVASLKYRSLLLSDVTIRC